MLLRAVITANALAVFRFRGRRFRYCVRPYNEAWDNERTVEVPIVGWYVRAARKAGRKVLEIGNVLSHYQATDWDILDRFEVADGVINEDAVTFRPACRYDLIVSISTLEHIGWDERLKRHDAVKDSSKVGKVIANLKENCLAEDGLMVATAPIGYNKDFDDMLFSGQLSDDGRFYLLRYSRFNHWRQAGEKDVRQTSYNHPFSCGNAVCVMFFGQLTSPTRRRV